MTWLTGPTVLLAVTLCVVSAQENDTVVVQYAQSKFTPARGSSVKLSCDALYDSEKCGLVHVVWCHLSKERAELTDPSKYFTTVNETVSDGNRRHRQVVTEILNLTTEDNGRFQCSAKCETGEEAVGHFIYVKVKD